MKNIELNYIDILKQIMAEGNMSQAKLAFELSVHQTTVGQWLLGRKKPSYDNILMIYEKFGVTPNEFFGIE